MLESDEGKINMDLFDLIVHNFLMIFHRDKIIRRVKIIIHQKFLKIKMIYLTSSSFVKEKKQVFKSLWRWPFRNSSMNNISSHIEGRTFFSLDKLFLIINVYLLPTCIIIFHFCLKFRYHRLIISSNIYFRTC
jgi:hypothetical protein